MLVRRAVDQLLYLMPKGTRHVRGQASSSSLLSSTLACLTTFRSLGVEDMPTFCPCSCSWKVRVRLATKAALWRATTDWRDFRAGQDPFWACRPPLALEG